VGNAGLGAKLGLAVGLGEGVSVSEEIEGVLALGGWQAVLTKARANKIKVMRGIMVNDNKTYDLGVVRLSGDGGNRTRVRKNRPTEIYERSLPKVVTAGISAGR